MQKLYILKRAQGLHLGHTKNDKSYVFAFQQIKYAHLANKSVSAMTKFDVIPKKIINDSCISVKLRIYTEPINTFKTNLFEVHEKDMVDLLTWPIVNNVGLVIVHDVLLNPNPQDACDPCNLEIEFDSILISPFDLFRSNERN